MRLEEGGWAREDDHSCAANFYGTGWREHAPGSWGVL